MIWGACIAEAAAERIPSSRSLPSRSHSSRGSPLGGVEATEGWGSFGWNGTFGYTFLYAVLFGSWVLSPFLGEDAWMRACACCPKRMTKSWRTCVEELCVSIYESTFCPAHSSRSQKNPTVCHQRSMDSQWARSHHQDNSCVERVRCLMRSVPCPFAENRTCGCWTEPGWIYESATFPEEEWRSNLDTFCWTVESLKSPIPEHVT